ncbi:MAG: type III secretion system export apparatus subunit SctT [Granulosicoccus sp.]|nr:type III secretion system export apparatus subunit SctT [Granulosicoccus sp.]
MNSADLFSLLGENIIVLSLSAMRVSVAFMLMPLFTNEGIPAIVRNSMFLSMALLSILVQPSADVSQFTTAMWISLFAKEALIGAVIGLLFGLFLWAFEAAGVVIDMQIGASFALFFDPVVGNEVTLIGTLLSRWATFLFLAAGGLMLMATVLLESFAIWPLVQPVTNLKMASVALFEAELSRFMSLTIRIAGPIMAVMLIIDLSMGLINRFAQQFNVFFLSMSIKSMATIVLLIVLLPSMMELLIDELQTQSALLDEFLNRILER